MRFKVIDDKTFEVYVNDSYLDLDTEKEEDLYDPLKKILINIKKKYSYDIYGFYEVDIYTIEKIATILRFHKKEESFVCKTVDLKLIHHNMKNVYLKFSDYYWIQKYKNIKFWKNNFYIKADEIEKKDIQKLLEFFEIEILKTERE